MYLLRVLKKETLTSFSTLFLVVKAQCFEIHPNCLTVPTLQNETILVDFQTLCSEWTISTTLLPLVFLSFNLIKLYSLNLLLRNAAVVLFCTCVLCYSQTSFWATFCVAKLEKRTRPFGCSVVPAISRSFPNVFPGTSFCRFPGNPSRPVVP